MSSVHGFSDDSIVLTLFYSQELQFKAGVVDRVSECSQASIKKAVEKAKSSLCKAPELCITIPSSLTVSGDSIIEGIQQALGEDIPIFGGSAADQGRFTGTFQFYNSGVFTDAAPFLLIAGPLLFSFGVESGWIPIGDKGKVTKVEKNVVYEIRNQTALDFYRYYFGNNIRVGETGDLREPGDYPLAVFEDDGESFYLRVPNFPYSDKAKGSITFLGNIPEGVTIQITHTTRDKIIEGAKKSVTSAVAQYPGLNPSIVICFSCAARQLILGTRVAEEYEILKTNFPDLPVAGFYTYGEIGPLHKGKPSRFHNETFLSLLLGLE
jgi:hypothetical protein